MIEQDVQRYVNPDYQGPVIQLEEYVPVPLPSGFKINVPQPHPFFSPSDTEPKAPHPIDSKTSQGVVFNIHTFIDEGCKGYSSDDIPVPGTTVIARLPNGSEKIGVADWEGWSTIGPISRGGTIEVSVDTQPLFPGLSGNQRLEPCANSNVKIDPKENKDGRIERGFGYKVVDRFGPVKSP